jgi:hypothetical protein
MVLFSGCASNDAQKTKDDEIKKIQDKLTDVSPGEKAEARKAADFHINNFFKSVRDNDYESFCKSLKKDKKWFARWHDFVNKIYGKLESQEYITSVSNPLFIKYLWKWKFSRKEKGKTVTREALYYIIIAKDKETQKYILFGAGF